MTRDARALALRLQVHYFLLFAGYAITLTYQNLHFKRMGLSDSQIGSLNAVGAILTVVSPPLWGYLSDRVRDKRLPLATLLLGSGALYPFFLAVSTYRGAALFQLLFSFFIAPCIALTDALVLEQVPRAGGDYARIRLWGSVGFICTMLLFGLFLGGGPLTRTQVSGSLAVTFLAFAGLRLANVLWLLRLPRGERVHASRGYGRDFGSLLCRGEFLLFLFAAFLSMTALRSYYVFFSIYLDGLGVSDSAKGIFWSIGVLSEVAFMVVAGRLLPRLGIRKMLALGMCGGAARLFLFSFPLPIAAVALAQGLHALAFGATHIATMAFINKNVPERLRATGQTLYAAVVGGIAGAAGSRLAGDLSECYGIPSTFRVCAVLAAAAAVTALFLPERKDEIGPVRQGVLGASGRR